MRKLRYALIPACISFGPFFIAIGGLTDGDLAMGISFFGALQLAAGLGMMLDIIVRQQQAIETLQSERQTDA